MYGIRIHGRGGEGAKTAARIIGTACFLEGKKVQDFAIYGSERRGAPVMSFVRIDDREILERGYITNPDLVAVMEPSLFTVAKPLDGLKKNGILLVNSKKKPEIQTSAKLYWMDMSKIASETLGRDLIDSAIVGGIAKLSGVASLESISKAIEAELEKLGAEEIKKNTNAAKACWDALPGGSG